jgi:hypothetical protein
MSLQLRGSFYLLLFAGFCMISKGQVENGLVAKYTFDNGDANDEKGTNNAKAVGASLVTDRFGNSRSAYYLQGTAGSYLNLGTSKILKPDKGSISIWFNIDNTVESGQGTPSNPIILTKNCVCDSFYEGYYLGYDYNGNRICAATTLSKKYQISLRTVDKVVLNKWYHVVITYDDDFLTMYVDGVLENRMNKNFRSVFAEKDSVMIGNSANKLNYRFLNGYVDDIRIYERVLTGKEVAELYNAPNPKAYKATIRWIIYGLGGLVILVLLVVLIVKRSYRVKLEKEQAANALNARLNELETKAIRTQMNPHFIFNSLNTLQRFILEEDTVNAQVYLTKFASLLRKMLESSTAETILLSEEIDIIKTYIEVEKLRFGNSFEYEIITEVKEPDNIKIPFMLIQPFVENAIWHGLMPKEGMRQLKIKFSDMDAQRLLCVIEDNGVGRGYKMKETNPLKKKSLAIEFIKQRLELLKNSTGIDCYFKITDKKDGGHGSNGTIVEVSIPKLS